MHQHWCLARQPSGCCMPQLGSTPHVAEPNQQPGQATSRQVLTATEQNASTLTVAEHIICLTGPHKLCVCCGCGVCIRVAGEGELAETAASATGCSAWQQQAVHRGQGRLIKAAQPHAIQQQQHGHLPERCDPQWQQNSRFLDINVSGAPVCRGARLLSEWCWRGVSTAGHALGQCASAQHSPG